MEQVTFTPLAMVKGNTEYLQVKLCGLDTELESAFFSVKQNLNDNSYIFQKTLEDGITQDPDDPEIYSVRIAPEDTAVLPENDVPSVAYWYDLTIGADGDIFTPLIGTITIVKGATEVQQ